MELTTAMLQNLHKLLVIFGGSPTKGITPHLYISILPFWDNKFNFQPHIAKGIMIERRSRFTQSEPMTVFKVDCNLSCLVLSPDGAHFLIGGSKNTWHIVDATTGVQSVISLNISCYCKCLA